MELPLNTESDSILKVEGVGQVLVKFRGGRFAVVNAACPKCQLGTMAKMVIGWMYLHPQPKTNETTTLAKD